MAQGLAKYEIICVITDQRLIPDVHLLQVHLFNPPLHDLPCTERSADRGIDIWLVVKVVIFAFRLSIEHSKAASSLNHP